ncbi:MAG: PIN domain-containing protein [Terrimicrobiaceae bacterium]
MSWLLDVNTLLANRWSSHTEHAGVSKWLDGLTTFYTTPIVELGFMRVSLSPCYKVSREDAHRSLTSLLSRKTHRFLPDDISVIDSPKSNSRDTTDAHLVCLAERHGLKLATLDGELIEKSWAHRVAINPVAPPRT